MINYICIDKNNNATYKDKFIQAYKTIFAEKPFYEDFSTQEVTDIFDNYINAEGMFMLAVKDEQVIAFSVGIPLAKARDTAMLSALNGHVAVDKTFYNADLGVLSSYRKRGIGMHLIRERIDFAQHHGYKTILMRTAEKGSSSLPAYQKLGFTILDGVTQQVVQKRINETQHSSDTRIFVHKTFA